MMTVKKRNIRGIKSPPAQRYVAIFELVRHFDYSTMMPRKFCDDISNGSGVMLTYSQTERQTYTQTDNTENNTTVAARLVKFVHHL